MKIRQVGADMFHAEGRTETGRQTEITKLIAAFAILRTRLNIEALFYVTTVADHLPSSHFILHTFEVN